MSPAGQLGTFQICLPRDWTTRRQRGPGREKVAKKNGASRWWCEFRNTGRVKRGWGQRGDRPHDGMTVPIMLGV